MADQVKKPVNKAGAPAPKNAAKPGAADSAAKPNSAAKGAAAPTAVKPGAPAAKGAAKAGAKAAKPGKWLTPTKAILIAVAGTLLAVGGVWTAVLSAEGDAAARNANLKLQEFEHSSLAPIAQMSASADGLGAAMPASSGIAPYVAPEAPDYETESQIVNALKTLSGYNAIAKLEIEKLNLTLPVLSEVSDAALKISVCKFSGPEPLQPGNFVITGHDYKNGSHFGKLDQLVKDDAIVLTDSAGHSRRYFVYDKLVVDPHNLAALDPGENTNVVTLVTCAENGKKRLIVKCRAL